MKGREGNKMIGTRYTSGVLAAFAKSPCLRRMGVKVGPDGREIAFYSRRYADGGGCAATVFDAGDRGLAAYEGVAGLGNVRFGFAVDKCIAKVAVRRHAVADALQAVSGCGFTSVVEWLHTKSNVFISFYENENENDPWLRVCEPA